MRVRRDTSHDRMPLSGSRWRAAAGAAVGAALLVTVLWPLGHAVASAARGWAAGGPGSHGAGALAGVSASDLARTLAYALAIGVLGTVMGYPAGWALRSLPARLVPLLAVPLLLPNYLAYAALGLARAPDTWLGDLLARGPGSGPNWWALAAARAQAILGLTLWSWPLAAFVVGLGARGVGDDTLDALRLDAPGAFVRQRARAAMLGPWLALSVAGVAIVMLGATVPFHLAQIDVAAVRVWLLLDQAGASERWRAWAGAMPLLAPALLAGLVPLAWRRREPGAGPERRRAPRAAVAWTAAAWGASVVLPLLLLVGSLREPGSLLTFWRVAGEGLAFSAGVAAWVGAGGAFLGLCAWYALSASTPGRGLLARAGVACSARAWVAAALIPGVLIGSATAAAWNTLAPGRWLADTPALLVLGHLARFGFVGVLAGAWLARHEPADLRACRAIDGADSPRAWAAACLPAPWGGWWVLAAAGLATACLSLHEIEVGVFVQPPGPGNLAQHLLSLLHFQRMEDLSAAGAWVVGAGAALALAAAWAAGAGARAARQAPS